MHLYMFVSLLSHVHCTQKNTRSVSEAAALGPHYLTTQHKTKKVLCPKQPNVNPLLRSAIPFSTKRIPGQQSRPRALIKLRFACSYRSAEKPV